MTCNGSDVKLLTIQNKVLSGRQEKWKVVDEYFKGKESILLFGKRVVSNPKERSNL